MRGLTLLEVLIAIAILAAMAAVIAPPLVNRLDQRRFAAAQEATVHQLLLARAHAQAEAMPVEVVYQPRRRMLTARQFGAENERSRAASNRNAAAASGLALNDGEGDDAALPYRWAQQPLPRGVRLSAQPPENSASRPAAAAPQAAGRTFNDVDEPSVEFDWELPANDLADEQPLRVAVFMPDGSAVFIRSVWLIDEDERASRLRINPITGVAAHEPHEAERPRVAP